MSSFRQCIVRPFSLFLGMMLCAACIKEDREDCPCRLIVDLTDVDSTQVAFVDILLAGNDGLLYEGNTITVPAGYQISEEDRNAINKYIEEIIKDIQLVAKKHKDVYFLAVPNVLGTDGTVDNSHPTDLGFHRFLKAYQPKIAKILKKYGIK